MESSPYPCICAVIRKTGRIVTKQYDHFLKPSGIKITQFSMLAYIARNPGITVSELAKLLSMDQTTVTRILRALKKFGYIKMEVEVPDQRIKRIKISGIGRSKMDQARPLWDKAQMEVEQLLGKENIDGLLDCFKKITG